MDNHEQISDGKTGFLIGVVVAVLVLMAVAIAFTANMASDTVEPQRSNADVLETEARIAPVGKVNLASNPNPDLGKVVVVEAPVVAFSAKSAYNSTCSACHGAGVMGAPKFGNAGDWAARIAAGVDAIYTNAINGKGGMPPRGGSSLTDEQVKAVVDYMLESSQ